MDVVILTKNDEVLPHVERVIQIADQNKDELGFLPFSAYEELALKGQLWIAVLANTDRLLGYLAFGGNNSAVRVSQLYVAPETRGHGVGSALIRKLREHAHASYRQIISARVASELPANRFWEKQGFYVIKQVPGGKTTGRTINVRVYELPRSSLLEDVADSPISDWIHAPTSDPVFRAPTYSVDLNVIFDVLHQRADNAVVAKLFSIAFSGEVRLCVSSEFMVELRRGARAPDADPLLKLAGSLPVLPQVEHSRLESVVGQLRNLLFRDRNPARRNAENDLSDLKHLAMSIHHGIKGFITRDRAIIRAAPALRENFGLEVLSPFDVIGPSNVGVANDINTVTHCEAVALRSVTYTEGYREIVRELLSELEVPELDLLEVKVSIRPHARFMVYAGEALIGLVSWADSPGVKGPLRCFLLVREASSEAQFAIDHSLGSLLKSFPEHKISQCELWIAKSQLLTRNTARLLGFSRRIEGMHGFVGLAKHGYNGVVTPDKWTSFAAQFAAATGTTLPTSCPSFLEATSTGLLLGKQTQVRKRAIDLFSFESELSPLLLLTPGRKAVLVPIRDKQASELLPSISIQNPLFGKEAVIRLERAYFGKSGMSALFPRGTIVVFYVSGADGGRAEAVGIARATASGTGSPIQLRLDLVRQGVLTLDDLGQMAQPSAEVSYFTFDSFAKFERPLAFKELKELGCIGPANLVTSQSLDFDKLVSLIDRSQDKGRLQ